MAKVWTKMIGSHLDFWPPPIYLPSPPFQQEQKNTIGVFQPCAPSISVAYLLKGNWSWSTCSCPPWWQSLGGELNRWVPSKWCRNWSLKNSLPNSVKVSTKSPLQAQVVRWRVRCKVNNGPLWGKTSWCTWRPLRIIPLQTDLNKASIYKFSNIQFETYHQHTSLSLFSYPWKSSHVYILHPTCPPCSNASQPSCCWGTLSPLELRIMVAGLPRPVQLRLVPATCHIVWRGGLLCNCGLVSKAMKRWK